MDRAKKIGVTEMVDVVTSLASAIDIVTKLRSLHKKIGEAEFKMLLADLTSDLGDAKLEAGNLKIALAETRADLEEWKRKANQTSSAKPEIHEGAYIFGDAHRHYCTGCFDARGVKILLGELTGPWADFGKWQCPVCDKTSGPSAL